MPRVPHPLVESSNLSRPRVARLRAAFWAVENALITRTVRRARAVIEATKTPATAGNASSPANESVDSVRVLRWVFVRGVDRLTCELALSDDDACYELRTLPAATSASRSIERFSDVSAAFQSQSALEGRLVNDGWSLETYDAVIVDRQRSRSIAS